MNILIISKSFIVKESVNRMLKESFKVENIKSTSDLNQISSEEINNYNFIIMNLEEDNLEDLKYIKSSILEEDKSKILVINFSNNESLFIEAIRLHVDGYITNIYDKEDFIYIVNRIISDRMFYEGEMILKLLNKKSYSYNKDLTHREEQVIKEVGKGYNNYEISERLSITEYTVKKHVSNILSKLNLKNRQEIMIYTQNNYNTKKDCI
ncbi:MAG: response regulator transcription factor [Bacilli bacterium]